jgi:hypothetical protein
MNKEFIPYEQALELEKLGFDEPCFGVYATKDGYVRKSAYDEIGNAPLYQQAFRWFREKYDLFSYIDILERQNGEVIYDYVIVNNDLEESEDDRKWNTFEEAELECLKQLIEITKNK